jgi:hypothetical protein
MAHDCRLDCFLEFFSRPKPQPSALSTASPGMVTRRRRIVRHRPTYRLCMMVNSHGRTAVIAGSAAMRSSARIRQSCTRSSASSVSCSKLHAYRRSAGIEASISLISVIESPAPPSPVRLTSEPRVYSAADSFSARRNSDARGGSTAAPTSGEPTAARRRGRTGCGSAAVSERSERTAQGYRRFRCRACGKQFNERSAGSLNRTQYPSDVIALVLLWRLRYRLSLRDLPEMFPDSRHRVQP